MEECIIHRGGTMAELRCAQPVLNIGDGVVGAAVMFFVGVGKGESDSALKRWSHSLTAGRATPVMRAMSASVMVAVMVCLLS